MIINKAFAGRYHLIKDGTGVPADGEKRLIALARSHGYTASVYAMTSPIYNEGDTATKVVPGAIDRARWRYRESGRWVPPAAIISKHVEVSREARALFPVADKFVLMDNSQGKGRESTILETFAVKPSTWVELAYAADQSSLSGLIVKHSLLPTSGEVTPPRAERQLGFEVLSHLPKHGVSRVAMVYDQAAYQRFLDKGKFDRDARDPRGLTVGWQERVTRRTTAPIGAGAAAGH